MGTFRSKWLILAWIALVATGVASNALAIRRLQMATAPLSPRYTDYAIPAAISALRGLTDYTAYMEVAGEFIFHKDRPIAYKIAAAKNIRLKSPASRWFVSGDDKGLIDLVYLGFLLFGTAVTSIYFTIGLLCLGSIVLYIAEFYHSGPRMALLVATLGGFYAVLFTFGLTDQSSSIIGPRFLGFIGIIPLLHVILLVVGRRRFRFWPLARAAAQIAIIIFVVHLRGSEMWQVLCIIATSLLSMLALRKQPQIAVAAIAIVLVLGVSLAAYREITYNPYYLSADVSTRVFWHNAVMGLGADPAIHERFKIDMLSDVSVTEAIKHYMTDTNRTKLRDTIFPNNDYANGNFSSFKWALYEPVAREFYFHILYVMPVETLKTYFVIMPKVYIASLYYMMGGASPQTYHVDTEVAESLSLRSLHDHYLKPLRIFPVILILASALLLAVGTSVLDWPAVAAIAIAIAGSSIPPLLVMPVIQYNQLFTMLIFAGAYFAAMMIVAVALRRTCKLVPFAPR